MRHNPSSGIMAQLVQSGAVIVDLVMKSRPRRHHHEIARWRIVGLRPANPEIRARRGNEVFGSAVQFALGQRRWPRYQPFVQSIALRGIEHGKALEERNRARLLAALDLLAPLRVAVVFRSEAVGIEHRAPALALADAAASGQRLAKGQPILRRIAALDHRAPEDQHIDPRVSPLGHRIAWQAGRGLGLAPRPDPRKHAVLKLGDDFLRDLVIKRCAGTIPARGAARRPSTLATCTAF